MIKPKSKSAKKLFLPVLALCSFLVGFDSIVTIPLIPTIVQDTKTHVSLGGLLVTAYAVAYAFSAPIFGLISDRWGRKRILFMGTILFAIATALTGIAKTFTVLIIFRILSGIGAGMIEPIVYAVVGDNYPYEKRGRAIGIVTSALISASIIGVPLGGYISEWLNWRWTFWLIAFLSILALVAIWISIPKDSMKQRSKVPIKKSFKLISSIYSSSSVLIALLATLLYYGGLQGMFANLGLFYNLHYDLTSGQIGLILMVAGCGSVIGSILGGKLADRFGKRNTLLYSSMFVAFSVFLFSTMTKSLLMAFLLNIIWATVYGLGQTALTTLVSELNPNARGAIVSLNSSAMYIGSGLFTTIAAFLLYGGEFLWVGILCGLANIFVLIATFVINTKTTQEVQSTRL